MSVFREPGYLAHNKARQDHLASLGLPLEGKSVLELGAGIGDHTKFFLDRGCRVTVTDGRPENVAVIKEEHPDWDVRLLNVEGKWDSITRAERWDIVYCYGLLYHCSDPIWVLHQIARKLRPEMLLLETCVTNLKMFPKAEQAEDPRCALLGVGSRPNRERVWTVLKELFRQVYFPLTQPDHDEFPLNWEAELTGESRAVYIASNVEFSNPLLYPGIVKKQTRYAHPVQPVVPQT